VLGSRGSVIPLFKRQILAGGPVTLTHPETTRFIMSLDEAVRLVMGSLFIAQGGEVFVTKMRSVRIKDLAEVMIAELAPIIGRDPEQILLDVIGTRPGEKLHEELLNDEEARRTVELEDFFVVSPALRPAAEVSVASYGGLVRAQVDAPYNSGTQPHMDRDELREFLNRHALLETRREPGQTTSD
jgi:FlaA1/EpsC-like NDP-sugar epimerase